MALSPLPKPDALTGSHGALGPSPCRDPDDPPAPLPGEGCGGTEVRALPGPRSAHPTLWWGEEGRGRPQTHHSYLLSHREADECLLPRLQQQAVVLGVPHSFTCQNTNYISSAGFYSMHFTLSTGSLVAYSLNCPPVPSLRQSQPSVHPVSLHSCITLPSTQLFVHPSLHFLNTHLAHFVTRGPKPGHTKIGTVGGIQMRLICVLMQLTTSISVYPILKKICLDM